MTGLVSEGALYGYARPNQDARGLHIRQFARAFIFQVEESHVVVVVSDVCMITQALHKEVLERLAMLYGDLYRQDNVMLLPQHTHSSPGGMHTYFMYQAPSQGFINETFMAYTDGIVKAIQRAHDRLQEGEVYVNSGELLDASDNRSPYAYYNNPEEELARYTHNTDKEMTILKIKGSNDDDLGVISFFPVHTTSMKNYNHLVSGDNKGYASQMFERNMTEGMYPINTSFVAAFAQSAEGDATPNTGGSLCNGTNDMCTYNTSTCPEDPNDLKRPNFPAYLARFTVCARVVKVAASGVYDVNMRLTTALPKTNKVKGKTHTITKADVYVAQFVFEHNPSES
ncbi:hypothetical protein LSH36_293g02004 [Paralvinella palmiformis]|uniref:Neutral ceramidase n=1 Tax=Paralvinella palmiformis TaxID=53620 RepID=A0AAD9N2Z2_9ANNE|nr:hypothetical protein LSH36_293g02004 [Paralvinella palmiformis]